MRHPTPNPVSRAEQHKKRENSQAFFGQVVGSDVEMKERDSSKLRE
jgi:hypothetical protein